MDVVERTRGVVVGKAEEGSREVEDRVGLVEEVVVHSCCDTFGVRSFSPASSSESSSSSSSSSAPPLALLLVSNDLLPPVPNDPAGDVLPSN